MAKLAVAGAGRTQDGCSQVVDEAGCPARAGHQPGCNVLHPPGKGDACCLASLLHPALEPPAIKSHLCQLTSEW